MHYADFYARSLSDREGFWAEQAQLVDWQSPFERVCDNDNPPFSRWFVGGKTNLCHNAVDRHLAERPDQNALIWVSTEVDQERCYTFAQLHSEVQTFAASLIELGVKQGDRVLIYMPMIPEAVFAMLACVRIGAIHSVVFGGFASVSLASRIDDVGAGGDGNRLSINYYVYVWHRSLTPGCPIVYGPALVRQGQRNGVPCR